MTVNIVFRFFQRAVPFFLRNEIHPFLRREAPFHPRCNICRNHCRLNRKGSGTAHRIHKGGVIPPLTKKNQSRRKSLLDGCLSHFQTIPSLMKGLTTCIQTKQNFILIEGNTKGVLCPVLRKSSLMINGGKPVHHRLLHHRLNVSRGKELGFYGACFGHPEGGIKRKEVL